MANPSKKLLFYGLRRLQANVTHTPSNPSLQYAHLLPPPPSAGIDSLRSLLSKPFHGAASGPGTAAGTWAKTSSGSGPSCRLANGRGFSSVARSTPPIPSSGAPGSGGAGKAGLLPRLFSFKNISSVGKFDVKAVAAKPLSKVAATASQYRQAAGLQVEAFWRRNYLVVVGAGAVFVCILLWRIMFGIASTFVGLSEGMAKYGFLALASAIVAFAGLYIRSRFMLNPDKIYRIAMRKLNTSAGILEVMGAPLAGTDVRAYIMSGGGPRLKNFKLKLGGKRCFLIFPIRGSERKGLVSVEAKKKKGQYDIKLLAVDVPMATGPDQRIFLIGDEGEYRVGGGLISELRDPIVKAMAAEKEFEKLDDIEEEEDAERELQEEERKRREEAEKLKASDQ